MTAPEPSSSRIIHISDIHCTTRSWLVDLNIGFAVLDLALGVPVGDPRQGPFQDTRVKCLELVSFLTSSVNTLRTNKILITGDLVDSGGRDDFDALARECLLEPLCASGFDVTVVPGNHDYFTDGIQFETPSIASGRLHFFNAFSRYQKAHAPDAYPLDLDLGHGNRLILLDSQKGHYDVKTASHKAQGNIGAQQLNWLRAALPAYQPAREGGAKIAIALHHSPFEEDESLEITDAQEFLSVVANRVDALLFGHVGQAQGFHEDQVLAREIPVVNSEMIDKMSNTGYPISVVDLSCNTVEVYSTRGGAPVVYGAPAYSYGTHAEAALIAAALG